MPEEQILVEGTGSTINVTVQETIKEDRVFQKDTITEIYMIDLIIFCFLVIVWMFVKITNV